MLRALLCCALCLLLLASVVTCLEVIPESDYYNHKVDTLIEETPLTDLSNMADHDTSPKLAFRETFAYAVPEAEDLWYHLFDREDLDEIGPRAFKMGVADMKKLCARVTRLDSSSPRFIKWWNGHSNLKVFNKFKSLDTYGDAQKHWKFNDMKRWYGEVLKSPVSTSMFERRHRGDDL